jgi:Putative metal-binding motif
MKSHKLLFVTFLGLVLIAALSVPANHLVGPTQASPDPCDQDEDGYSSNDYPCGGNDCDDFNSAVNPAAEEICTDNVDNDCDGDTDYEARQIACAEQQWLWLPDECLCSSATPIVLDLGGNGCRFTDAPRGVDFDINSDGRRERLSWTSPDADEAFLALDRNGNGVIDDGAELFGNFTAQPASEERNGFMALAEFDKSSNGGNEDGMISANDAVFSSLLLWEDSNHNGTSEPAEIHSFTDRSITAIELKYRISNKSDVYGNVFRYRAKAHDVNGPRSGRWVWDVVLLAQ